MTVWEIQYQDQFIKRILSHELKRKQVGRIVNIIGKATLNREAADKTEVQLINDMLQRDARCAQIIAWRDVF